MNAGRDDPILFLQRMAGNHTVASLLAAAGIQAKLKMGAPGDRYEREADRMAEHVLRMPSPAVQMRPG